MNILFINSISKNKFGGGEKWMVKAARGLHESGHTVFLASKKGAEILKYAKQLGVQTRVFNVRGDFSPFNTYKISRFLKKNEVDILICNLNKDVRVAGLAARIAKTPAVIARHGVLLCGKKWKHKITLTNLVDGILTNTNTIKSSYLEYGWFQEGFIQVVYNGIEDKDAVETYDFSKEYPGKKIIFSAGRLSKQKGYTYLIEAAAILSRKRNDLVFLVAGKGSLLNDLKHQVAQKKLNDTFIFCGFKENVESYTKGCHLFVLPSLFEGMPNAVMEAMAVGKAVVATDVNGNRELMEDNQTGIIVPPRDPESLSKAIENLIDDENLLQSFGEKGMQRVKRYFTVDKMIRNLELYFKSMLNGRT